MSLVFSVFQFSKIVFVSLLKVQSCKHENLTVGSLIYENILKKKTFTSGQHSLPVIDCNMKENKKCSAF